MIRVGFSTGVFFNESIKNTLELLIEKKVDSIEISSLRESEFESIINSIDELIPLLSKFKYVSFHAPSKLNEFTEVQIVDLLKLVYKRNWPIIVHPDIITDFKLWRYFGKLLCIENMDARKSIGKLSADFESIFNKLPQASLCFDIAHSYENDSTLNDAKSFLVNYSKRITQIHISAIGTNSRHTMINRLIAKEYKKLSRFLPWQVPFIVESPVDKSSMDKEIMIVRSLLPQHNSIFSKSKKSIHLHKKKKQVC